MNDNNDLNYVWKLIEDEGFTAIHSYRDSKDGTKWYCQLLHPNKDRIHGIGSSYVDALVDAIYGV